MHTVLIAVFATGIAVGYFSHWWQSARAHNEDVETSDLEIESADESEDSSMPIVEECKMVLGVRMDLKMDKGKIAAQCGHATLASYKTALRMHPDYVRTWSKLGQTKIAIKVPDEEQLTQLHESARRLGVPAYVIQDAGRTQVAPGSRTVIGIGPAPISKVDPLTRSFKLL